jgi:hypothetical protein
MKNFYIFEKSFKFDEVMQMKIMQQKAFNKIICFPKNQPIIFNSEHEKFCLNVKL